jgi:anti-sigma regulatory factor (Ser/Thr protein kinase)
MARADTALGLDATYPAHPPQVALIRRAVSEVAAGCGADFEILVRLGLAVSEAATNVVLHAYRTHGADGEIHVTARHGDGVLHVCIRDYGGGMAPRADSPGMGLGLCLMATECDHFEIRDADGGGTEVLLSFGLDGDDPAPLRRRILRHDATGATA